MKCQNQFRKIAAIALLFILAGTNSFAQKPEKDKILANKTYIIELTETGGKKSAKPVADEISFKAGKLGSKFMIAQNKFPAVLYTVSVDSSSEVKEISFTAESTNQDKDILKWEGMITDETIEGTATWEHKGKTKKEYSFTGTLKAKKK